MGIRIGLVLLTDQLEPIDLLPESLRNDEIVNLIGMLKSLRGNEILSNFIGEQNDQSERVVKSVQKEKGWGRTPELPEHVKSALTYPPLLYHQKLEKRFEEAHKSTTSRWRYLSTNNIFQH